MTDDTFTTDSSPGEQAFESAVDDAVDFFENLIGTDSWDWYDQRNSRHLQIAIRAALWSDRSVSPERLAREVKKLGEQGGFASKETVDPILQRLEAMIDESGAAADRGGGHHG